MAEQATQKAQEQKPQEQKPQPPATAMTEAGFSMNVKMLDPHGQEVQLTFRCALASNSDKLITHYTGTVNRLLGEGWQATKPGARANGNSDSGSAAPSCRIHGGQMKPSKKPGGFYCPRKLADGTYCAEKVEGGQG